MKRLHTLLILLFTTQVLLAQHREINSMKDLPVLNFPTGSVQPLDSVSISALLKVTAARELQHLDSIRKNFAIHNYKVQDYLEMTRAYCQFITADWKNLAHADTVLLHSAGTPEYLREGGISELAAYARVMLLSNPDLNQFYISTYKNLLTRLTFRENLLFNKAFSSALKDPHTAYKKGITTYLSNAVIADTTLYKLQRSFVYSTLTEKGILPLFNAYTNQLVVNNATRADSLRGTLNAERNWWNVLRYDITVKPDYLTKTISGKNIIRYKVVKDYPGAVMQIDLQEPLVIDSILYNTIRKVSFKKDGNAWHVKLPRQKLAAANSLSIFYHGQVHAALHPPWDGGWIWKKDSLGNPWMSVACQGIGASIWYPCKDHQSDEPDNGVSLSMIVPDTLVAVGNGRLKSRLDNKNGTVTYKWEVTSPINNYLVIPYIGKYVNLKEVYKGEKGNLDLNYWLLPYNVGKARIHMLPEVHRMLKAHEHWFGPYPFYEDGYKLVDAPYEGMENQSNIAYGNGYQNGQEGRDASGTGWGMKWDLIIVHESAHEWWGNNITSKDIADMWVHESFGNYSETLFTEYWYGKQAGIEYNVGIRKGIENTFPVIGHYGINDLVTKRCSDMYPKGGNMIQNIRHSLNDDEKFRGILRGLGTTFYHQTVTTAQIENYISQQAGFNYQQVFDQYLTTVQIPRFEFSVDASGKVASYRYTNCIPGFNLPLVLVNGKDSIRILPTGSWQKTTLTAGQAALFDTAKIEKMYYMEVRNTRIN